MIDLKSGHRLVLTLSNLVTLTTMAMNLLNVPDKCIYSFIDSVNKKIYVCYSSNTLFSVARTVQKIKSNAISSNNFEFKILEPLSSNDSLRIRYQFWCDYYLKLGYELYNKFTGCNFKIRIDVIGDYYTDHPMKYYFYVKLVSKGHKERIVGIFDNLNEMNAFVETHYKVVNSIVYSSNSLTLSYLESFNVKK